MVPKYGRSIFFITLIDWPSYINGSIYEYSLYKTGVLSSKLGIAISVQNCMKPVLNVEGARSKPDCGVCNTPYFIS